MFIMSRRDTDGQKEAARGCCNESVTELSIILATLTDGSSIKRANIANVTDLLN